MKQTMLSFMEEQLEKLDFAGELNLNWDRRIRSFEIEIKMTGQVHDLAIDDQQGQTQKQQVDYEDAILLYDQTHLDGLDYQDNYLAVIAFDSHRGISQAKLQGLFTYLQSLLDDSMSDFLDFLDPQVEIDTFQMQWSQDQLLTAIAAEPETSRNTFLPYPRY